MRIEEIENNSLRGLTRPQFNCDKPLGRNVPVPYENQFFFTSYIGVARSGKTSLAIGSLVCRNPRVYRNIFHNIIVFMPNHSRSSLEHDPFEDIDPEKTFSELNIENLSKAYDMIEHNSANNEKTLLFFDDMTSSYKNHDIALLLNRIIQNRRHLKTSIMILAQYWNSIFLNIRKNVSSLFLFKCSNKEWENIREELLQMDRDEAKELRAYVYQNPHDFLLIKPLTNELYRNFNKLDISEN